MEQLNDADHQLTILRVRSVFIVESQETQSCIKINSMRNYEGDKGQNTEAV